MTVQAQLHETLTGLGEVSKELDQVQSEIDRLLQHQQWLVERKNNLEFKANRLQAESLKERPDVTKSDFAWSEKLHTLKKTVFGVDEFRPLQEQTMNATLSGQDCILVMPTGGGKSLCFQLPALVNKGFTLVISPLISLMEDQTMSLEEREINASLLNAGMPQDRVKVVHQAMIDPQSKLKLLYVTPEKLAKSKRFMAQLEKAYKKGLLARVAIDEVHCCSQWGHDFRPDYKILGLLKRQFPDSPILGLTATATNSVLEDVKKILNIQGCVVYRASYNRANLYYQMCEMNIQSFLKFRALYNRANLYYQVRPKPSKHTDCIEEIVKLLNGKFKNQSGIIYCFSRKQSEQVASDLQSLGIRANPYHASLEAPSRSAVHRRWKTNQIQVVVATVAFGMGIDKPDVRFVIHHSLSKSIENYYQESGRAGRDEQRADCILFFKFSDVFRLSTMVVVEQTGLEKLYSMAAYCISQVKCRRSLLASHFGERWDGKVSCKGMCDNCVSNAQVCRIDIQTDCRVIYSILTQAVAKEQRMTGNQVADVMQGKTVARIQIKKDSKPVKRPRSTLEHMLLHLLLEGYLKEDFHFTPYSTISYLIPGPKSNRVKTSPDHPIVFKMSDPKSKRSNVNTPTSSNVGQESKSEKSTKGSENAVRVVKSSSSVNARRTPDNKKVMVIELSDDSSDEASLDNSDISGQKRKRILTASRIESDTDEDMKVLNNRDNSSSGSQNAEASSKNMPPKSVQGSVKREKNIVRKSGKQLKAQNDQQQTCKDASKKCSSLGKRKGDDQMNAMSKVNNNEGTPAKKRKSDAKVSSVTKDVKLEKSKHDKKQTKGMKKIEGKITKGGKSEVNKSTSQKLSLQSHVQAEPNNTSHSGKLSTNTSISSDGDMDELHTVYSEQLASLELMEDSESDSEAEFQK